MSILKENPLNYSVFDWRPVTADRFVEILGEVTLTSKEPALIVTTVESLPDGRVVVCYEAECKWPDKPDESFDAHYLMSIHDPETGKKVCLQRTNLILAL